MDYDTPTLRHEMLGQDMTFENFKLDQNSIASK